MRALLLTLFLSITLLSLQAQSLGLVITPDTVKCTNDTILLEVSATLGIAPYTYQWSPSTGLECDTCTSTYAFAPDSITYTVVVADSNLVTDTAYITVGIDSSVTVTGMGVILAEVFGDLNELYADSLVISLDSLTNSYGDWVIVAKGPDGLPDTVRVFGVSGYTYRDFDQTFLCGGVKSYWDCEQDISACFTSNNSCRTYCIDTTVLIGRLHGSIADKNTIQVNIHPNPVNDMLAISGDIFSEANIALYNTFGQMVLQHQVNDLVSEQLDVSQLIPGIYILHIRTKDGLAVHRVVKN